MILQTAKPLLQRQVFTEALVFALAEVNAVFTEGGAVKWEIIFWKLLQRDNFAATFVKECFWLLWSCSLTRFLPCFESSPSAFDVASVNIWLDILFSAWVNVFVRTFDLRVKTRVKQRVGVVDNLRTGKQVACILVLAVVDLILILLFLHILELAGLVIGVYVFVSKA